MVYFRAHRRPTSAARRPPEVCGTLVRMTSSSPEAVLPADPAAAHDARAARTGQHVSMAASIAMGVVLVVATANHLPLAICVGIGTLVVTLFCIRAGAAAGRQIARRPLWAAPLIGIAGGLSALLTAACVAGLLGACWSFADHNLSLAELWRSYVRKPFLAVLLYGIPFAATLGTLTGLVIAGWLRLTSKPTPTGGRSSG